MQRVPGCQRFGRRGKIVSRAGADSTTRIQVSRIVAKPAPRSRVRADADRAY
ncbi:hypothetical protein M2302_002399 [Micromonospora sp. A200]|uniref:hypothetical protein n=1 Tax=Micromonospora sp. A200 TaxID=2940568 RepID=UPI002477266D|nr:hypothetical protein [Micromonospora sp. A200]MDH6462221.1 hypothetical protein [Micromonospora sp. A200]